MKPPATRMKDINPSLIRRLFDLAQGIEGIISLGIGEPDFDTPEHIKNAAKQALDDNFTHYTPVPGTLELRVAIADYLNEAYGLDYKPESEIVLTCGATEALHDIMLAYVKGDEVLVPDPGFLGYPEYVRMAEGKPVWYPCPEKNGFQPDLDTLNELVTKKTVMIIINSPCNPTGAVFERKTLEGIAEIAIDNDLLIVTDEVYEKFIYEGKHIPIASLGVADRTILVNGFSKTFSMTGWRLGYICGDAEVINAVNIAHMFTTVTTPSFAQKAALTALKGPKESIKEMKDEYRWRRDFFVKELNTIENISCIIPNGTFYAFPNISAFGKTSVEFSEYLIEKAKVVTVPGNAFGSNIGEGHVRMSYACTRENLKEALSRIKDVLSI
ncbi:pyridoxal phosphate-dependent aminotransferase [Candidatus Borrarchaeum sp.]|uniref:pyridoxal phosphate-dependent aminotransferase n=1 Tax=Candidatus Borrarchaeum sp. TaxID=2846742 RepID=UPI00257B3DFD|nr:pyridoxal phosphate-dependent aminotransferase [Candidatus Borrarchaeum sp.]